MESPAVWVRTGIDGASSTFPVACGLSVIFGVTRIVNFVHGSFYMLGAEGAYSLPAALVPAFGSAGVWIAARWRPWHRRAGTPPA